MTRYEALSKALEATDDDVVDFTFEDLDLLVDGLPPSARKFPTWWANSTRPAHQSRHWISVGFKARPDFAVETIHFTRVAMGPIPASTLAKPARKARASVAAKDAVGVKSRKPVDLLATGEVARTTVLYEWVTAGAIDVEGGRLDPPTLSGRPGVYRITVATPGASDWRLVGETDNLALEMNRLRHPDPTQPGATQVTSRLLGALAGESSATVELVVAALVDGESLDFAEHSSRVLVENLIRTDLRARGALVET
jgi:hypothetical protein